MGFFPRLGLGVLNEVISTSRSLDVALRQGAQQWSGMSVTPDNALQVGALYACVRVIAEDIGKLPFVVNTDDGSGNRQRARSSPYWRLVHDRFMPGVSSQQGREYLTACALLRGNGYALKNPMNGPMVRELLPLHPDRVEVEVLPDFAVVYHVCGFDQPLTSREVFHLKGPCLTGAATGTGVVGMARQTIGRAMAIERHAATFFGNGLHPGGVFRHPKTMGDKAQKNFRESLKERASGDQSNDFLILEEGMEWTQIGLSNEDSQFLETAQLSVEEICRFCRVPPHKVAHLLRATFSNIEHQSMEYVTDSLMPWARRWEDAVNQGVIVTNGVFAELLFDALLRGDTMSRYQAMRMAVGGPWQTRNEARRLDNLPPIDGADALLEPANMPPMGEQAPAGVQGVNGG